MGRSEVCRKEWRCVGGVECGGRGKVSGGGGGWRGVGEVEEFGGRGEVCGGRGGGELGMVVCG